MEDILLGALFILVGALFCFRGYLAMRFVIPIWGAFAGFSVGAGLVASFTDEGFLASLLGWGVGLAVAVVFGLFAYLYYSVAVLLGMAAIGFAIGTTVMAALGVTWSWLIILVGVAVGAVLAFVAIVGDMPMVLLTVLTAAAGASTIIAGVFLLLGKVNSVDFESPGVTEGLAIEWWWYAVYALLLVIGIGFQVRSTENLKATLREAWEGSAVPRPA
jgi:hypothetical protein